MLETGTRMLPLPLVTTRADMRGISPPMYSSRCVILPKLPPAAQAGQRTEVEFSGVLLSLELHPEAAVLGPELCRCIRPL